MDYSLVTVKLFGKPTKVMCNIWTFWLTTKKHSINTKQGWGTQSNCMYYTCNLKSHRSCLHFWATSYLHSCLWNEWLKLITLSPWDLMFDFTTTIKLSFKLISFCQLNISSFFAYLPLVFQTCCNACRCPQSNDTNLQIAWIKLDRWSNKAEMWSFIECIHKWYFFRSHSEINELYSIKNLATWM